MKIYTEKDKCSLKSLCLVLYCWGYGGEAKGKKQCRMERYKRLKDESGAILKHMLLE